MNDHFNVLFIAPTDNALKVRDHYTSSGNFPVIPHFETSHQTSIDYLNSLDTYNYPSIIILAEEMGSKKNLDFINHYRSNFYLSHIDTLIYIGSNQTKNSGSKINYPPIISGIIPQPFNKQVFMQHVFPHLTVHVM